MLSDDMLECLLSMKQSGVKSFFFPDPTPNCIDALLVTQHALQLRASLI